jgi:predicted RNA-binding Zn ribbon-like protein
MGVSSPPHDLQRVIDFVNTLDLETGADALPGWLGEQGLEAEAADAAALREALRAAALAHNGGPPAPAETLDRVAREMHVSFGPDGAPRIDASAGLARLLVPVVAAAADGTWARVKACRDESCQWAFYDHSRNRSGRWCDMAVCGNRTKVRAYRQRRT